MTRGPLRKLTCPHCGKTMDSYSLVKTTCSSCHKQFVPPKIVPAEAPSVDKTKTVPEVIPSSSIKVEHIPEPRHPPVEEKLEEGGEVKPQVKMVSPSGIYTIFIELPNSVIITIRPDLGKDLELTDEEIKMFKEWATQVYDYCISHGITIPDYLELLPIIMTPLAFYLKRVRLIISAKQKKKEEPKEPEVAEPGVDVSEENARKAKEAADMKALEAKLKGPKTE